MTRPSEGDQGEIGLLIGGECVVPKRRGATRSATGSKAVGERSFGLPCMSVLARMTSGWAASSRQYRDVASRCFLMWTKSRLDRLSRSMGQSRSASWTSGEYAGWTTR